jgi:hypothetical protein
MNEDADGINVEDFDEFKEDLLQQEGFEQFADEL